MGTAQGRPVVVGSYEHGQLRAVPTTCPDHRGQETCDVVVHFHRRRKTGPSHALTICRCHSHGLSFTVYPAGFAPYGRRDLADDIEVVLDAAAGSPQTALPQPEAALEPSLAPAVSRTRARAVAAICRLLGLNQPPRIRESVSFSLGIPLTLMEVASLARHALDRLQAVADILDELRAQGGDVLHAIVCGGSRVGLWGPVSTLHPQSDSLVPALSHSLYSAIRSTTTLMHGGNPTTEQGTGGRQGLGHRGGHLAA